MAVDHDRITMSLRETQASAVTRAIASPADPASRLRVIAWLAGNLARDQVGGLVASPFDPPDAAAAAPSPLPSLPANETPPAAAPQDLAPPPFASPVATVTAQIDPKAARPARWTIGAAAGFGVSSYQTAHVLRQSIFGSWNFTNAAPDIYRSGGTVWRVEARRRGEGTRLFTGLALEGAGNGSEPQVYPGLSEILGAMALVGSAWQLARWSLEADLGAGIDLAERGESVYANTISTSPNGERLYTTSYGSVLRPGLFASASFAAAHPVGDVLDAVATLDVHQSLVDEYDGYFALTLGIRCRL
ncbi:MAG TPA: hypothetical protein VHM31_05040 [Polyangia bacterium]|nr:hypothetical protein [Polyangia bacterium]